MKFVTTLALATASSAFIVPDVQLFEQLPIEGDRHGQSSWLTKLPTTEEISTSFKNKVGAIASAIDETISTFEKQAEEKVERISEQWFLDGFDPEDADQPHRPPTFNLTIYQLISESNHTSKFAKFVDEYEDIVALLNSTKANYTLFVPTNAAFKNYTGDKKPSKEFIETVLKYHIGEDLYPARKLFHTHTLPTVLEEKLLGNKPQRLRIAAGIFGIHVNLVSKVVAANIVREPLVFYAFCCARVSWESALYSPPLTSVQ
jgi:uncharacterized surface protein with fasciclin (FAS1) repeats